MATLAVTNVMCASVFMEQSTHNFFQCPVKLFWLLISQSGDLNFNVVLENLTNWPSKVLATSAAPHLLLSFQQDCILALPGAPLPTMPPACNTAQGTSHPPVEPTEEPGGKLPSCKASQRKSSRARTGIKTRSWGLNCFSKMCCH